MISIIVPTYNECETIIDFLDKTTTQLSIANIKAEIVVVDDNSPDGTADIIENYKKSHDNVVLVKRSGKMGLSSACIHGFSLTDSKILGVMDSDLSHAPNSLPYLINPILYNFCDITVGSRYISGGRIINWPFRRYMISRFAGYLGSKLTTIKDVTSGYFFFKRKVIDGVVLNSEGFKICLEILVKGNYQTVIEVPYTFSDRVAGKSKMGINEILFYLQQLYKLHKYKKMQKNNSVAI